MLSLTDDTLKDAFANLETKLKLQGLELESTIQKYGARATILSKKEPVLNITVDITPNKAHGFRRRMVITKFSRPLLSIARVSTEHETVKKLWNFINEQTLQYLENEESYELD